MVGLFQPVALGKLELKNRVVRSATWDATADSSGAATDESVRLFQELGQGAIGLIVTGHAYVSVLGQSGQAQYGIHSDDVIPGLRRLVEAAHHDGSRIAVQITHCGINSGYLRKQGIPVQVVSRREDLDALQEELTDAMIEEVIDDFAMASRRAVEAGFDAVQLHGAHGYLMGQFLSPLYNQRADRWGGSASNRRRFHIEVIRRIRQLIGNDFPLLIKFGVQEDREGGLPLSEGLETAREMVEQGVDAIEISAGDSRNAIPRPPRDNPDYVPFRTRAAATKRATTVPVILVGGIRNMETANEILRSGDADLISMCRPFIREPHLLTRWRKGEAIQAKCISCSKCMSANNSTVSCAEESRLKGDAST